MDLLLTGLWQQATEMFPKLRKQIPDALNKAVLQEAQDLRKRMVSQFRDQAPIGGSWAPLSLMTLRARRAKGQKGTKILIASADMRNSIAVTTMSEGVVFVGVNRSAKGKSQGLMGDLVNLGQLHEFGKVIKIRVTRKMQRYLFGVLLRVRKGRDITGKFVKKNAGRGAGSGKFRIGATIVIRIPARPFVAPAVNAKTQAEYESSIAMRMAKLLEGKIGK